MCDTAWPHGTEALIEKLHTAPETFFVAEALGTVVAFLQASVWHNWPAVAGMEHHDPDAGDSKLLNWLTVDAARRGRGLGGALLDAWLTQLPAEVGYVVLNPWPADDTTEVTAERLRRS